MQAAPKPTENTEDSAAAPAASQAPEAVSETLNPWEGADKSPARALQARLARELRPSGNPWHGHTAGLVLATALAVWIAAIVLNAGI